MPPKHTKSLRRREMFHEIFDWTTHRDSAGPHFAVPAGDSVWAQVTFKASAFVTILPIKD